MQPTLEARALSKAYGGNQILRDISFSLKQGSYTAIVGRSGSGKSTLFRILAGLEHPDTGTVVCDGVALSSMTEDERADLRLRRIGLVFQSYNLLPDLTVLENVRLPLDISGTPRKLGGERGRKLLDLVNMGHTATRRPNVLSGGEAQRVAIARALANDPSIILADEPTGSLDRANAESILGVFDKLNSELGATILLITHDPLAMGRAHRLLEVQDGHLREVEGPAVQR